MACRPLIANQLSKYPRKLLCRLCYTDPFYQMDQIKQKKLVQLQRMQEIQQKAEEQMIKRQIGQIKVTEPQPSIPGQNELQTEQKDSGDQPPQKESNDQHYVQNNKKAHETESYPEPINLSKGRSLEIRTWEIMSEWMVMFRS